VSIAPHILRFVEILIASTVGTENPQKEKWFLLTVDGMSTEAFKTAMETEAHRRCKEDEGKSDGKVKCLYYLPGSVTDVYYHTT
jgi:hypothetical protein